MTDFGGMFPALAHLLQKYAAQDGMRVMVAASGPGGSGFVYASPDVRSSLEPCAVRSLVRSLEDAPLPSRKRMYVPAGVGVLEAERPMESNDSYMVLGTAALERAPVRTVGVALTAESLRAAPSPQPANDATFRFQLAVARCMLPSVDFDVA